MKKYILLMLYCLLFVKLINSEAINYQTTKQDANTKPYISVSNLKATGWVNDFAGVLDATNKKKITLLVNELEKKTTAEIAVVTLYTLGGNKLENFATSLFNKWGVGKKYKYNGVIILLAVKEKVVRIEIGRGLTKIITNNDADLIIKNEMFKSFKVGNYGFGLFKGTRAVANMIVDEYNDSLTLH
ncbi:MAG: TPM domain-containing protein [Paludibacter sp.]